MVSKSGNLAVSFNGEIYNYRSLRDDLVKRGSAFSSGSDTEVLLEACDTWGVEAATERLVGMFSFAIWNRVSSELKIVRDRLGIKPMYWALLKGSLVFGSELRAIRCHPAFEARVNFDALALYLRRSCVPAPYSIYQNVYKLEPGHVLTYNGRQAPTIKPFWSVAEAIETDSRALSGISDQEGIDLVDQRLREAVRSRMVADVPFGAFLSGGVDSSTVVALMQDQSQDPVRTFSLGFSEPDHNEAPMAASVARHLGTQHTELYVTPADALDVIPELPHIYDEPFADSSQIPTYLVSSLARRHVTVAMSGDGGDEVFGGYNRHRLANSTAVRILDLPQSVRLQAARALLAVRTDTWRWLADHGPSTLRTKQFPEKIHKAARVLEAEDVDELYEFLTTHWFDAEAVVLGSRPSSRRIADGVPPSLVDPMSRVMYLDTINYLPDDILTKVDRASMSVSLEARVPLIDHRLVELMWHLPRRFRIRRGVTKWALRRVLYRYVPPRLIDRPKQGFGMPIGLWLRGPLREWAEALLDSSRLRQEGYFDPALIRSAWADHLAGRTTWEHHLWDVLMFQAWLESGFTARHRNGA